MRRITLITLVLHVLSGISLVDAGENVTRPSSTLLVYGACDNDGEPHFLAKVDEMIEAARGFGPDEKIFVFIDRAEGYSEKPGPMDEVFTGARVYLINNEGIRLFKRWEDEPSTGNPEVLARFVKGAMSWTFNVPISLVIYGHGNGGRFAYDETGDDDKWMSVPDMVAALTPVLGSRIRVRHTGVPLPPFRLAVLGFDVCNMGLLENAAAVKTVAHRLVASAPLSGPWPYASIIRMESVSNDMPRFGVSLGRVAVRELEGMFPEREDPDRMWQAMQSWALINTEAASRAWATLRELEQVLSEERDTESATYDGIDYRPLLPGYDRSRYPYVDAYDFAAWIAGRVGTPPAVREAAIALTALVEDAVIASFGGALYGSFEPGRHGLGFTGPAWIPPDQ